MLTAGVLLYLYFFLLFSEGSGPAGPVVSKAAFSSSWSERPVVLLGLGDSITAGFGAKPKHSFFERLVENPPDDFQEMQGIGLRIVLPKLTTENVSVNGSTSIECLEKQFDLLTAYPSDTFGIVVITTGGNDIIHMYGRIPPREGAMYGATFEQAQPWIANYEARLDGIVGKAMALFPGGCRIYLGNIYDPSDGLGTPEAGGLPPWKDMLKVLAAYNECIGRCAEKYEAVELVDIHAAFLGHGIACRRFWNEHYDSGDPHYWYFSNIEDPNDRGHDALRRLFLLKMAENLPHAMNASVPIPAEKRPES